MCAYHGKILCAPHQNGSGRVWDYLVEGGTSRGCYVAVGLVGWLACAGGLVMPGGDGPICAEAGTFHSFC